MIHTQDLDKIVSWALCSSYIEGDKPLSLLIVSDRPESGKTRTVTPYCGTRGVDIVSDLTGYGLKRDYWKKITEGTIKHLIIPELLTPLARGKAAEALVSLLQGVMEDGTFGLHTGFTNMSDQSLNTIGIIACIPRHQYTGALKQDWQLRGFLSRFVVVTYSYSDDTIDAILSSIRRGEYLVMGREETHPIPFDGQPQLVRIPPETVGMACQKLGLEITEDARKAKLLYGFREIKHIRAMVAANVILENITHNQHRDTATMQDFAEVERLGYLFNTQYNPLRPASHEKED